MAKMPTCEVCEERESVGVASVPGVPYSAAYCEKCLRADAHPYGILVNNTACLDGMKNAGEWWVELVERSLSHLKKTREQFDADVETAIKSLDEYDGSELRS